MMMQNIRNSHKDFLRSQSLVKKRKKRRTFKIIFGLVFVLICVGFVVWLTTLSSLKIQKVVVVGNINITTGEIQSIVNSTLDQKYSGLFSKRNSLIYPKNNLRDILLGTYPRIADVQIYTEGFQLLNIKIKERDAVAVWCVPIKCYMVASDSYIYAEQVSDQISNQILEGATTKENPLPFLSGGDDLVGPEPVGKHVFTPTLFSSLLYAVGELGKLNLSVKDVQVFSRDEIVFNLKKGGKVIFADRKPFEQSVNDLKSAIGSPVFSSTSSTSSFDYIDTRFGNKVFYKK